MTPPAIKKLRERLRLTQEQFSELLHANRVTIAKWEIGKSRPTGLYLLALKELAEKAMRKRKAKKGAQR